MRAALLRYAHLQLLFVERWRRLCRKQPLLSRRIARQQLRRLLQLLRADAAQHHAVADICCGLAERLALALAERCGFGLGLAQRDSVFLADAVVEPVRHRLAQCLCQPRRVNERVKDRLAVAHGDGAGGHGRLPLVHAERDGGHDRGGPRRRCGRDNDRACVMGVCDKASGLPPRILCLSDLGCAPRPPRRDDRVRGRYP